MTTAAAEMVRAIVDESSVGVRPAEGLGPRMLDAVLTFEAKGGLTARQAEALATSWARYDSTYPRFVAALRPEVREALLRGLSRLAEHAERLVTPRAETLTFRVTPPAPPPPTSPEDAIPTREFPDELHLDPESEGVSAERRDPVEQVEANTPPVVDTPQKTEHADSLVHLDTTLLLAALDAAAIHHGWTGWVTYSDATGRAVSRLLGAPSDAPVPASAMRLSTRWICIPVRGSAHSLCETLEPDACYVHLLVPRSARTPETWSALLRDAIRALLCGLHPMPFP